MPLRANRSMRFLKVLVVCLVAVDVLVFGVSMAAPAPPPPDGPTAQATPGAPAALPTADEAQTPDAPAPEPTTPPATPTSAPRPSATATARASAVATANPTPTPSPSPTLRPPATPRPTASALVLPTRTVSDVVVAITATTGISSTSLITITEIPPPAPPVTMPAGTVNIAFLGVDTRPAQRTKLSDVIVIASVNPGAGAVTLMSFPRDVLVYIPNYKSHKFNVAYNRGGAALFKSTVKYNFGLNVDYVIAADFQAVVNGVTALDGIDVVATCPLYQIFPKDPFFMADPASPLTVTAPYTDTFTGEVWQPGQAVPTLTIDIPTPGVYSLDGLQTLAYARARYGVAGGDPDRGHRVQEVIRAMVNKARQAGALTRAPALFQELRAQVETDLTIANILSLAQLAGRIGDGAVRSKYFEDIGLAAYTLPEVGFIWTFDRERVNEFLTQAFNPPPNMRTNEGIPIDVRNGTRRADFGVVASARLRDLGFAVAGVRQADRVYGQTVVIDFGTSQKGSAIPLMQRSFALKPQNVVSRPTAGSAVRYQVVIGEDFDPCYKRPAAR